jgi:hypothetical protein
MKKRSKKCISCDAEIPAERLNILPNTQHCVRCVDKHGPKVIHDPEVICAKPSLSNQNGFARED